MVLLSPRSPTGFVGPAGRRISPFCLCQPTALSRVEFGMKGRAHSAMADTPADSQILKRAAAVKALDFVTDGMKLGLGTGSTAEAFSKCWPRACAAGWRSSAWPLPTDGAKARVRSAFRWPSSTRGRRSISAVDGADEADRASQSHQGRRRRAL